MPNAGHLYELFHDWTPDAETRGASWSTIRHGFMDFLVSFPPPKDCCIASLPDM